MVVNNVLCYGSIQDDNNIAGVASWQLSISPGEIVMHVETATKHLELAPGLERAIIGESSNC